MLLIFYWDAERMRFCLFFLSLAHLLIVIQLIICLISAPNIHAKNINLKMSAWGICLTAYYIRFILKNILSMKKNLLFFAQLSFLYNF